MFLNNIAKRHQHRAERHIVLNKNRVDREGLFNVNHLPLYRHS